jgi:hypothetical protein
MYVFFIRAFNDVDHLTPIVWKMGQDKYPIAVYCINPEFDIQNDYRLDFLKKIGIQVDYIYRAFDLQLGGLHRLLCFLFLAFYALERRLSKGNQLKFPFFPNVFRKIGRQSYKLTRKKFYDTHWAHNILVKSKVKALCFDWVNPKQFVVDVFLQAAQKLSIPTLSLPHGAYLYTNDVISYSTIEQGGLNDRTYDKYNQFDYIIVQNQLYKDVMARSGVNKEKIIVLGSTRYCREWMQQNKKILPRIMKPTDAKVKKLKVVFMTTKTNYRINVEEMFKTFDALSEISGVECVIKPHTRTGKEAYLFENLSLPKAFDVSSVELCEWADVVLVIGSSILIEALVQNKPVLYLKYLHENITQYEEFGSCWIIHDVTELQNALLSLQTGNREVPYTQEHINKFLSEIVYGGRNERDVLLDYEQFIVNCSQSGG